MSQARHVVIRRPGGPDVLNVEPFEVPPPREGELAIEVRAIGLNFADVFTRLGLYDAAPPFPCTPGFEVSGDVAALGPGVTGWSVGDRAIALTRFGGYATRVNAGTAFTKPLPAPWTYAQGAGFPVVHLTAWYALVELGRVRPGELVVVQSAAGGVGMAACRLARRYGARVIGTVGSDAKAAAAREAGAEDVIVSACYDVWDEIRRRSGRGVDLVLDAVGGRQLRGAYRALAPAGRLVTFGFAEAMPAGGVRNWPLLAWRSLRTPRFAPLDLVSKNRTIAGFNLAYLWHRRELLEGALRDLLDAGLDPLPTTEFPFERVADAQRLLQSRRSTGKIVLTTVP